MPAIRFENPDRPKSPAPVLGISGKHYPAALAASTMALSTKRKGKQVNKDDTYRPICTREGVVIGHKHMTPNEAMEQAQKGVAAHDETVEPCPPLGLEERQRILMTFGDASKH